MSIPSTRISTATGSLVAALCLAAAVIPSSRARASVGFEYDRELVTTRLDTGYRTWTIDDSAAGTSRDVSQLDSRLLSTFTFKDDFDLVLRASGGYSHLKDPAERQIDGPADTRLKGFLHLFDRRLLLSAGVNLPTGSTALDDEEIDAVRSVSPTVLGFRTRVYGQGPALDLGIAAGTDIRPGLTVGGGVSMVTYGSYDLDQTSEFKPGLETAITGGFDVRRPRWVGSLDLAYRLFGTDQLDGEDSFEEGNQLEMTLAFAARGRRVGLDLQLRDVLKGDNTVIVAPSPTTETRITNGSTFWLSAAGRYNAASMLVLKLPVEFVTANQSQQQTTSAWSLGFGVGAELQLTGYSILDLRILRLTGASEDGNLDLSGLDGSVGVRWQY